MVYKIMHGLVAISVEDFFQRSHVTHTRGHNYKLFLKRCNLDIRKYFFAFSIVSLWNGLPPKIVNAGSIKSFKNLLQDVDFNSQLRWKC